jgi:hypothetical protein
MSCSIDLRNVDGPMKGIISSLIICCNSMWVCTDKQNKYIFLQFIAAQISHKL